MGSHTAMPMVTSDAFGALETGDSLNPDQIDATARALLAQLTLDEKVDLMSADPPFWSGLADMFRGGYNAHVWPAGATSRLGIPGIRFSDGPRGIVMRGATTFPVSMARGAAWDVELEERIGDVIGRELRALGGNFFGGVCINLLRHPAWGRAQETYGEDTHLLGAMGAALVRGVQRHVMACAKHYALNSMENARFKVDVTIDARALHEVYLPHFKRTVEAGVASIMSAYNSVNGEWCGQNAALLTDILKREWSFEGFVMTDFIFGMRDAKKAALAGQDLEMPFQLHFQRDLKGLVERGEVPVERVDDACSAPAAAAGALWPGTQSGRLWPRGGWQRAESYAARARPRRRVLCCSRTRATCCRCTTSSVLPSSVHWRTCPTQATPARAIPRRRT